METCHLLDRPVILTTYGSSPERMVCICRTRTPSMAMVGVCSLTFHFPRLAYRFDTFFGGSPPRASYRMRLATCLVLFASARIPRWVYLDSNYPRSCVLIDSPLPSQLNVRPHSPADNSFHPPSSWRSRVSACIWRSSWSRSMPPSSSTRLRPF
jgi:hypothetical protein